jgi:TonB family protein
MNAQAWPIDNKNRHVMVIMVTASVILHGIFFSSMLIYPLLFKKTVISVPILEVVQLDKPKIRIRRPITKPQPIETKPAPKPDAPRYTNKPKSVVPPKTETEIRRAPDTTIKKVVREYVREMTPKMVMQEQGDPRLSFWIKRVQKKFQTHWNPPGGINLKEGAELSIVFTVTRDGSITNSQMSVSSGNSMLDGFALDVVERVGRLPRIPPNYREKEELSVKVVLPYTGY